jgi:hypothetical protein
VGMTRQSIDLRDYILFLGTGQPPGRAHQWD